jgi:hypothetical protein
MRRDVDLLKKLRGGTFEMPSGLRMEEAIDSPSSFDLLNSK